MLTLSKFENSLLYRSWSVAADLQWKPNMKSGEGTNWKNIGYLFCLGFIKKFLFPVPVRITFGERSKKNFILDPGFTRGGP